MDVGDRHCGGHQWRTRAVGEARFERRTWGGATQGLGGWAVTLSSCFLSERGRCNAAATTASGTEERNQVVRGGIEQEWVARRQKKCTQAGSGQ
jgi:hypothetical protein